MVSIYDVIIVGATPEGIELAKKLADTSKKVIIISSKFYTDFEFEFDNLSKLEAEAVFLSYTRGLIGVNVLQGDTKGIIYGTNLVLATGTKPIKASLKNANIRYKALDILGKHKSEPVVVYGNNEEAGLYALDLAKRFCYVYFCTKDFELNCSKRLQKKINETANIVHLPGCSIISCKNDKDGKLAEITLDTYATITTTALVFALGRIPDMPSFARRFIDTGEDGFADVKEFNESKLVPGIYAIGNLCRNNTKKDITKLATHLITKGGQDNA
jgi:thioredoxin reductase